MMKWLRTMIVTTNATLVALGALAFVLGMIARGFF